MNLQQKKIALEKLTNSDYVKADMELLKISNPRNRIAKRSSTSSEKIVWALLMSDVSPAEIEANRKRKPIDVNNKPSTSEKKEPESIKKKLENLVEKVVSKSSSKSKKKKSTQTSSGKNSTTKRFSKQ